MQYSNLPPLMMQQNGANSLTGVCVAVVGLGALGNEVVRLAGLLGVRAMILIDHDVVEADNLSRSLFYRLVSGVGVPKARVMKQAIEGAFPEVTASSFERPFADVGYRRLAEADVLFSCVDNDSARLEIAYAARQLAIPVSDGGLGYPNIAHGRATIFPAARASACFSCLLPSARRRELLVERGNARSCSKPPAAGGLSPNSSPVSASVVASLQVAFGSAELSHRSEEAYSVSVELDSRRSMTTTLHPPSKFCSFHDANGERQPAAPGEAVRDLLARTNPHAALRLDWPVCARARCASCNHEWRPMSRTTHLPSCPRCHTGAAIALETIERIDRQSAYAGISLTELDQPEDHLFDIRVGPGA